jgi:hypothetical protein
MDSIIDKLDRLKSKPGVKKDKIYFGGSEKSFEVYEIDLDLLAYNHLNERIIIKKSEYEQTTGNSIAKLDIKSRNDLIEEWIWNKDKKQNETTKKSIKTKGQQRYGVITSDGIVVSGNRRFTALRKLKKEGTDKKFEAIILDSTYSDGGDRTADIKKLEKELQHGEEDRIGYGAIEKYISVCLDMEEMEGEPNEKYKILSSLRSVSLKEVKKYHNVGLLMIEYLEFFGMNKMYSRLKNTEEGFLLLQKRYSSLMSGRKGSYEWMPNENDFNDYKYIGFTLIRWIYNADPKNKGKWTDIKKLRKEYFDSSAKYGVFSREENWKLFKSEINFEKLEDLDDTNPNLDLTEIKRKYNIIEENIALEKKDKLWAELGSSNVRQALNKTSNKISHINQEEEAHVYLEDALLKLYHLIEKEKFEIDNHDLSFKRGVIKSLQSKDSDENFKNADRVRKIAEALKRDLK